MPYAVGAACFRSAAEAAAAYCASVHGATSEGVVSCHSASIVGQSLTYSLRVDSGVGATERAITVELGDCEPYDWEFYGPVVGVFALTLVLVVCVRLVGRPFNRDTL